MIRVDLAEYEAVARVDLDADQVAALHASRAVSVLPSPQNDGTWMVQAAQYVGVVTAPGLDVRIRPKLPVGRLLFLLAYADDPRAWQQTLAAFGDHADLITAIAHGFVHHAERAVHVGVLQGYRHTEEALTALRGRLRENDQMRWHLGRPLPLEVSFDDYTVDIAENRILRTAARRLLHLPRIGDDLRRRLRALDLRLDGVHTIPAATPVPAVRINRLNERYRPVLALAEQILRSRSFDLAVGRRSSTTFVFDMNQVFERFLEATLLPALSRHGGRTRGQHPDRLDHEAAIAIRPDLTWWSGRRCLAVADAKYKRLNPATMPNADVYQMLAYCTALGVPDGHLVYPAGEVAPTSHTIRGSGVRVHIRTVDLSGPPGGVQASVEAVAAAIRRCARGTIAAA